MGKSNGAEIELGIGGHVQLYIYRLPKKNHDAMVWLNNRYSDVYRNTGPFGRSSFNSKVMRP
jgi:hypothetical protein